MAKKNTGITVKLLSTAGTGYYYVTNKNARKPGKLELSKYDAIARKHVIFKETKVK